MIRLSNIELISGGRGGAQIRGRYFAPRIVPQKFAVGEGGPELRTSTVAAPGKPAIRRTYNGAALRVNGAGNIAAIRRTVVHRLAAKVARKDTAGGVGERLRLDADDQRRKPFGYGG